MNDDKRYKSLKIPDSRLKEKNNNSFIPTKPQVTPLAKEIFYEIDYDASPIPSVGKIVLKTESQEIAKSPKDPIREIFRNMRDIAWDYRANYDYSKFFNKKIQEVNAAVFYKQAVFMEDFTDDYAKVVSYNQYFPCYQMMGYEQLRTYFTWRTQVRQGIVTNTSASYAFLYVYELINNIGVDSPQEGLEKLMAFWGEFREHNVILDGYMVHWIKDYHVYYDLPQPFKEFVQENNLTMYYPNLIEVENNFELFNSISKYNIKNSNFYTEETSKMISECFIYVIKQVKKQFEQAKIKIEDAIFKPTKNLVEWIPFRDALFFPSTDHINKQVVLSKNEIYILENGKWKFSTILTAEKGKQFIGYIMKQMEASLRKMQNYKPKLSANTTMINRDTLNILTEAGLYIDIIVANATAKYCSQATKTVVAVDHDSLEKIRKEALLTQEALIVEEEIDKALRQDKIIDIIDNNDIEEISNLDSWDNLRNLLSENELKALEIIIKKGDIKAFINSCDVMLEVFVDSINEKAMDYIGDNIIDEELNLYDDYQEQIIRILSGERNG